jgi:hypothetical protein
MTWSKTCWIIALPLMLSVSDEPQRQRFWGCLALLGVAGVSFSTVADVFGHDAMWIALQFWRVLWLLAAMQWLAVAMLIRREWRSRPALLWLLAICWLLVEGGGGGFVALAIAGVLQFDRMQAAKGRSTPAQTRRFAQVSGGYKACLVGVTVVSVLWWSVLQAVLEQARINNAMAPLNVDIRWLNIMLYTNFVAIVAAMLCTMYVYRSKRSTPIFYVLLFALLAFAIANMDQRSPPMKVAEARLDEPALAPFAGRVMPGQMVYWDGQLGDIVYPWLLMRTASYFSPTQSSGIVFHRQTTFEALHRAEVIRQGEGRDRRQGTASLPTGAQDDQSLLFRGNEHAPPLTRTGIAQVCRAPNLDFVVSQSHYTDLPIRGEWAPTKQLRYWLYDCKQINTMNDVSAIARTMANIMIANTTMAAAPRSSY